jgi:hypothetical protein
MDICTIGVFWTIIEGNVISMNTIFHIVDVKDLDVEAFMVHA